MPIPKPAQPPKTYTDDLGYTFPMAQRERDRLLNRMTPDARAWFYEREMKALGELGLLAATSPPKKR